MPWSNTEISITVLLKNIRLMPRSFPISSAVGRNFQTPFTTTSFFGTSDSVRIELLRLASDCSLSDVAYIKMHTSPYRDDTELDLTKKKAVTFFAALDKQPLFNKGNAREKTALYRDFLATTKEHGINNQKELLSFLEQKTVISAPSSPISVTTLMLDCKMSRK